MKDGTLETLLGSGKVADTFNVANKVYAKPQAVASYIDGSLSKEALPPATVAKETPAKK